MTTPFDAVVEQVKRRGFHNQRSEGHSDIVSDGILADLKRHCPPFFSDFSNGRIADWKNIEPPGRATEKSICSSERRPHPAGRTSRNCGSAWKTNPLSPRIGIFMLDSTI